MTHQTMKRRLSAVLHADVQGYSRLMSEDEVETVRTLTEYRNVLEGLVQEHGGRVVDTARDGFLVDFPSVMSALDFAVSFHRDINERNIDLSESRRMKFRIGLDVGEIIDQGDKIFGDAVNIAARLDGLAEGGVICISGNAYDQARKRSRLTYQYLGEKVLKNIDEPVRAYCVLMEPIAQSNDKEPRSSPTSMRRGKRLAIAVGLFLVMATAVWVWHSYVRHVPHPSENPTEENRALSPDEQPSIAVIPFSNLSGGPGQDFFSDGITEEIITTLSKVPDFLVIAGNSSFAVKGKPLDIQQLGRDLRARYLLQGGVRKGGGPRTGHCSTHRRRNRESSVGRALRSTAQRHSQITGRNHSASRLGNSGEACSMEESLDEA